MGTHRPIVLVGGDAVSAGTSERLAAPPAASYGSMELPPPYDLTPATSPANSFSTPASGYASSTIAEPDSSVYASSSTAPLSLFDRTQRAVHRSNMYQRIIPTQEEVDQSTSDAYIDMQDVKAYVAADGSNVPQDLETRALESMANWRGTANALNRFSEPSEQAAADAESLQGQFYRQRL